MIFSLTSVNRYPVASLSLGAVQHFISARQQRPRSHHEAQKNAGKPELVNAVHSALSIINALTSPCSEVIST